MGENKGVDFIDDMHERANHNINPYYWFNRVTPFTTARFVGILLFSVYWVIAGIGTVQSVLQRIYAPPLTSQPERRKEKKKKYPKRPKNYK